MLYKNYEYFLAIANKGSLTKAAESLYITQPSLSKYLSRLESSLNMELFDRSSSPMKLTYAGKRYYEYVQNMLALDQRLSEEFDEIRDNVRGEVTIGIASWRSGIIMPTLLPMFHQRYPHIHINVEEGRSYTFERAMLNGRVDFCMMTIPSSFSVATTCESMGMEKLYLAGNLAHPAVQKCLEGPVNQRGMRIFDISLLNGERFINLKPGQVLAKTNDALLARNGVEPAEVWCTENMDTAMNVVDKDLCFTVVPALYMKIDQLPPNLVFFELGDPPLVWEMGIVYKKNAYVSHIMRLVINAIKELYGYAD